MSVVGVLVTVAIIGFAICATYLDYKNKNERERSTALAEETAKRRAKENLTGKRTVVVLRKKDGGLTMLETLLIRSLIDYGASVVSVSREIADQIADGKYEFIPEGLVGFVGLAWATDGIYHLDVRAMRQDGEFITSAYANCRSVEVLAEWIAREIGSTLRVLAKIEASKT